MADDGWQITNDRRKERKPARRGWALGTNAWALVKVVLVFFEASLVS